MISLEPYTAILCDMLAHQCVLQDPRLSLSVDLDRKYILSRIRREGAHFLTISLPSLRKSLDKSFETGYLEAPNDFGLLGKSKLPVFMNSHFRRVFADDGALLFAPDIDSIRIIRQVTGAFYKLELPYSKATRSAALKNFVDNEIRIMTFLNNEYLWATPEDLAVSSGAALLVRRLFRGFSLEDILPKNGPGALATGETGDEKWRFTRAYRQLENEFPVAEYFAVNGNHLVDRFFDQYIRLDILEHGVSKVNLVPKDSRGPRIITMEPHEYQWIQQGIRSSLVKWLENHRLTSGRISFTDQSINQRKALEGSLTGEWATLDMKDASDLVSTDLVKLVFRLRPDLLRKLLAARTPETEVPDFGSLTLKKFAGMGAAFCFPVEATIFWALSVSAIALSHSISLDQAADQVYVYGDDIIVRTEHAQVVMDSLEAHGLRVNRDKSYYRGDFRESCGIDAFLGVDISLTSFHSLFPTDVNDGSAYASYVAYLNDLKTNGFDLAADTIKRLLEEIFGPIPYGTDRSGFPCIVVTDPEIAEVENYAAGFRWRWNDKYQRLMYRVRCVTGLQREVGLDDWDRLFRNLISGTGDDPSHTGVGHESKISWQWRSV